MLILLMCHFIACNKFKFQIKTKQNKTENKSNKTKSKSGTCEEYQEEKEIHSGVYVSGIRDQNIITQYICQCFDVCMLLYTTSFIPPESLKVK